MTHFPKDFRYSGLNRADVAKAKAKGQDTDDTAAEQQAAAAQPQPSTPKLSAGEFFDHLALSAQSTQQGLSVAASVTQFDHSFMKKIRDVIDTEGFKLSDKAKEELALRVANKIMDKRALA